MPSCKPRLTVRLDADLRRQLVGLARDLGLDVNGLINLMIRRSLDQVMIEAYLYRRCRKSDQFFTLLKTWEQANPGPKSKKKWREFQDELRKHLLGEPSSLDGLVVRTDG